MLEGLSPARRRFVVGLAVLALVAVRRGRRRRVGQPRRGGPAGVPGEPGTGAARAGVQRRHHRAGGAGRRAAVAGPVGGDRRPARRQHRRPRRAGPGARQGRGPPDAAGRRPVGGRGRVLRRRRRRPPLGARPRRRQPGPPDRHDRLAAPRHRPGRAGRRRRPGLVPRGAASSCCPTASCSASSTPATRRPPARCGCRSGRPTTRSWCRRRPPTSRAPSTSPSSRSAPALEVTHGDLPRTPAVIAAVTRELAVAEPAVPGPEIC